MKIISFGSVLAGKGIYIPDLIKEKLVVEPFTMNVFGLPEAWKNKVGRDSYFRFAMRSTNPDLWWPLNPITVVLQNFTS